MAIEVSGEVWVQETASKDVYCLEGRDFTIDPYDKQGDTQDYTVSYDTGDGFKIEYHIEERPEGLLNYQSNPKAESCRIIKNSLVFTAVQ